MYVFSPSEHEILIEQITISDNTINLNDTPSVWHKKRRLIVGGHFSYVLSWWYKYHAVSPFSLFGKHLCLILLVNKICNLRRPHYLTFTSVIGNILFCCTIREYNFYLTMRDKEGRFVFCESFFFLIVSTS